MLGNIQDADIKRLRFFCTIVECGGFTAAQAALNISASSISLHMSTLESRLGGRLCERGHGTFQLTQHGQTVYEAAKSLFDSLDEFRNKIETTQKKVVGELRIGFIDNSVNHPHSKLCQALADFSQQAPQADINLRVGNLIELETLVVDGQLHLAIGSFPHGRKQLRYTPMYVEQQMLYCGLGHQLFDDPHLSKDKLLSENYVSWDDCEFLLEEGSPLELQKAASSSHIEGVAGLILSGRYIGYLPVHYAEPWVQKGAMRTLLPEITSRDFLVHMITKKASHVPRVAQIFLECLVGAPGPQEAGLSS